MVTTLEERRAVQCGFCGGEFAEDRGQAACRSCPLGSGCGRVRCPRCGYENPLTPRWVEAVRGRLAGLAGRIASRRADAGGAP